MSSTKKYTIQHKPLINNLPLSYEQTCDLETALVIAKNYLKSAHGSDPAEIIPKTLARYETLYSYISNFNRSHRWTEIVLPPEIEKS